MFNLRLLFQAGPETTSQSKGNVSYKSKFSFYEKNTCDISWSQLGERVNASVKHFCSAVRTKKWIADHNKSNF